MQVGPVITYHPHPYGGAPAKPPYSVPVPQEEPRDWPAPQLPGEDDGRTWDPCDPPLFG